MGILGRLRGILVVSTIFLVLGSSLAFAEDVRYSAPLDQLRALFVQRFVKYVSWPEQTYSGKGTYVIAAADVHPLRPYFNGKDRFRLVQWPSEQCQILLLNESDSRAVAAVLKRVSGKPVLTVGQSPEFLEMGGIINFVESKGRLRLQVNLDAARRSGLVISSRLLKLAEIYREGGE